MSDDRDFADFLRRIRAGDPAAAVELVRRYESLIRREIRLKLQDPSLHRDFDSVDVCQSVLASFFVRAAAGEYDLTEPVQLVRLLIGMARNKAALAARRQCAQRRDGRRLESLSVEVFDPADPTPTPSRVIAARDLLDRVRERLSNEERLLADLRGQGQEWPAIAAQLGGTADARRMQLSRALDRVMQELGLDEEEP